MATIMSLRDDISAVRRFSRFYTREIGLLSDGILDSSYSLTEARVLYELAQRSSATADSAPAEGSTPDTSTAAEIAADLNLDPGYLSRVLRRLERLGLVEKERSEADRRRMLLKLTPTGRGACDALDAGSRSQIESLLSRLGESDRQTLVASMATIEQTLSEAPARRVTYRPHRPGDMGWIVQRHGALYHASHGWDETFEAMVADIVAGFIQNYDPSGERSWIAEVDGRRAGAIALMRRSKTVAQLRLLFVEPWARGLGIGSRLVSECVGQARHCGYSAIILFTVRGLDAARRLYEAEGFQLVEETPAADWGPDHITQQWELKL